MLSDFAFRARHITTSKFGSAMVWWRRRPAGGFSPPKTAGGMPAPPNSAQIGRKYLRQHSKFKSPAFDIEAGQFQESPGFPC